MESGQFKKKSWRRIRNLLLGVLAVTVVVAGAVVWAVQTGAVDRWIAGRLTREAARYGARLELESLHLTLRSLTLRMTGVRLSARNSAEPIFSARSLEAELKLISFFSQRVSLVRLDAADPVLRIRHDEPHKWNLSSLSWPSSEPREKQSIEFASAVFNLSGGTIVFEDSTHKLSGKVSNLAIRIEPSGEKQSLHISLADSEMSVGGKRFDHLSLDAGGLIDESQARATHVTLKSPSWEADVDGRILDWKTLRYELRAAALVNVAPLGRALAPELGLAGTVKFKGNISGERTKYIAQGDLTSAGLSMRMVRTEKFSLSAAGTGEGARYQFTGQIDAASLLLSRVPMDAFHSPIKFDGTSIELPEVRADLLGGEVQGSARLCINGGELSSADLSLRRLSLERLSEFVAMPAFAIDGTADAAASLQWRGFSIGKMNGTIDATASGSARARAGGQPAAFQCSARLSPHGSGVQIESSRLEVADAVASVNGSVDSGGVMSLGVDATMRDLRSAEQLLRDFGVLPANNLGGAGFGLGGQGIFKGNIGGTASAPEIKGQFEVGQLSLRKELAGRVYGQVQYQSGELRLKSAVLERPGGSTAHVDLRWPLGVANGISIDARLSQIDLGFAIRAVSPSLSQRAGLVHGKIDGEMHLSGLPGIQTVRGQLDVRLTSGEIKGEQFGEIAGRFTLDASRLKMESVRLDLARGKFTLDGSFSLSNYDYDLKASAKQFDLSRLFASEGGASPVAGVANVEFEGRGNYEAPSFDCTIASSSISVRGQEFTKLQATGKSENGFARFNATAEYFGYSHAISATLDLRDPDHYALTAEETLSDAPAQSYLSFIPNMPAGITGKMSGRLQYSAVLQDSSTSKLRLTLSSFEPTIAIEGVDGGYQLHNDGPIEVSVGLREAEFSSFRLRGEGTNVEARGSLAFSSAGANTLKLSGEVNLQLFSLGLSRGSSRSFFTQGTARLEAAVSGAGADARLNGTAEISGMSLRWLDLPLTIENGQGRILFSANQAELEGFHASAGGGTVSITGGFILKNLLPDRWRYQLRAEQVRINYPAGVRSILEGDLTLQGNNKIQVLSGAIAVRRAEYAKNVELADLLLESRNATFSPAEVSFTTPLALDLRVDARDSLFVRTNFADAAGSGTVRIRGPVNNPAYSGRLTVTRGTIDFRSQRYTITRGLADLPDRPGAEPYFNIEAESDIRGYRVILTYAGTFSKFTLEPRSEPALPVADVVALITTGNILPDTTDKSQLLSQANVGAATSLLSETLTRKIEQQTDRLFGLNRFQLDPLLVGRGTDPTARITLGRRVTKDLTITYSTNVSSTQEQVVLVEYRLSDRVSLVGLRDEKGKFGFDLRFRKRF